MSHNCGQSFSKFTCTSLLMSVSPSENIKTTFFTPEYHLKKILSSLSTTINSQVKKSSIVGLSSSKPKQKALFLQSHIIVIDCNTMDCGINFCLPQLLQMFAPPCKLHYCCLLLQSKVRQNSFRLFHMQLVHIQYFSGVTKKQLEVSTHIILF